MLKGFVSGEEKDIVRIPMKGRNLLQNEETRTIVENNGITFTRNPDGSITANGTATARAKYTYYGMSAWKYGYDTGYYLSGCPSGGSTSTYSILIDSTVVQFRDIGAGKNVNLPSGTGGNYNVEIRIENGVTVSNLVFKPMLNLGSTALPYEPYGYQEGWEVRDNQDRLIWGREDEFQTATGTLPFKGYALPVKVKSLLGNAVQNGTPTPDNPVMPTFCGARTGNLWDKGVPRYSYSNDYKKYNSDSAIALKAGTYTISSDGKLPVIQVFDTNLTQINVDGAITNVSGYYKMWDGLAIGPQSGVIHAVTITLLSDYILTFAVTDTLGTYIMLNSGSTALPYEPFGYKIPITCAGQTVPVYLGQTQTVRRVRKLVLTGKETLYDYPGMTGVGVRMNIPDMRSPTTQAMRLEGYCTHFPPHESPFNETRDSITFGVTSSYSIYIILSVESQQLLNVTSISEFKTWFAAQYAAGTPVTVWYVLKEPETAIVNEPLCKIGDYADELNDTVATLPEIPTATGQNTLTVDTTLAPSSLTISVHAKKIHYGFKIDKSVDDSEDAVIYTHDAVTMTPAHMDFTNDRFDYGSWGNAFFVRDCYPVALNLDGTEAYRLDPDDYTKKMDGTPSDIFYELLAEEPSDWSTQWKQYYTQSGDEYVLNSQSEAPTFTTDTYYKLTYTSSFTGNFMMAFPKVWFYRHEDSQYNYIEISNHRLSDDWKCYAHINTNGQEVKFIYLPLFKGVIVDSKLRSLPGQIPQGNTTATTEVNAATALGSRWQIWDHSSAECLNDLLTLMSKSIDSQGRFGQGRSAGYDSKDTVTYGKLQTGTLIKKGKFHGYSATTKEVKVFGLEGFWANRWDRLQGMLLVDNVWQIKMTPPYNFTGTDFVILSNAEVPSGNGYLSKVQTSEYGSIPASIANSSSSKYFKDYFYKATTGTRVARRGGGCDSGSYAGFRCVSVNTTASSSSWGIGASPVYK